jgi:hypothetical protein
MRHGWPAAWRALVSGLPAEVGEALHLLAPVCEVLEGKSRSVLDALPPEQREFCETVLARFEGESEPRL